MKTQNPLAAGFIQGLQFDTLQKVSPMHSMNTSPDFKAISDFYCTCEKTIRRWHDAGVDLESPMSVVRHILDQQNPSPDVLDRMEEIFN
tara:strand:- start:4576 stop:4842 length:267 start_codon:yes stop_codon:yes gene_type:complete